MQKISVSKKDNIGLFRALIVSLAILTNLSVVHAQEDGKIKVSTNRFIRGGQVVIQLIGLDVLDDLQNGVRLNLAGEYCDARKKYLEKIDAEIRWQSTLSLFDFENTRVRFLVDGKEVSIDSAAKNNANQGSVKHFLLVASIPLETLREISAGGHVEMQIGAFKFRMNDDALSKLREFADKAITIRQGARKSNE
jgi:hypothetical protein